jgi:hypothetical protein
VTRQSQHNPTYGGKEFVFGVDPEVADVANLNFKLFNWNHGKNDDLLVGFFVIKLIDLTLDPIEQQNYNFFEGRSSERRVMGANAPTNAVVSVRWVSASGVVAGGGDAAKGTEKETNRKTIGDQLLFHDTITAKPSQWAEVERAARRAARDEDAESLLPEKVYQPAEISPRGAGSGVSSMLNVFKSLPSPPVAAGRKYGGGDQCPRCLKTVYFAEAKEGPNNIKYHK